MSFRQYRLIDICFFIGMYALCEYLAIKAATVWFDEPYSISIMLPLLVIVMMRWDKYCIIPCIVYAILFVFYHRGSLLYLNKVGKEKIRKTFYGSALFLITGFLLMELSRGLASMLISGANPYVIIEFILTDMLSLVFGILVIIIVRQVDGLFVDQKEYLLQINSQEEKIDGGWQDE